MPRTLVPQDSGTPGQRAADHSAAARAPKATQPLNEQIQFFWSWNSSSLIYMKDLSYKVCSHLAEVTASAVTQGSLVYGRAVTSSCMTVTSGSPKPVVLSSLVRTKAPLHENLLCMKGRAACLNSLSWLCPFNSTCCTAAQASEGRH